MNKQEAQVILSHQIQDFRCKSYDELTALIGDPIISEIRGPSGTIYQVEVQAFWDHPDRPQSNLRVIIAIDNGGFFSSLLPMTDDFILTPDGEFVDE